MDINAFAKAGLTTLALLGLVVVIMIIPKGVAATMILVIIPVAIVAMVWKCFYEIFRSV